MKVAAAAMPRQELDSMCKCGMQLYLSKLCENTGRSLVSSPPQRLSRALLASSVPCSTTKQYVVHRTRTRVRGVLRHIVWVAQEADYASVRAIDGSGRWLGRLRRGTC